MSEKALSASSIFQATLGAGSAVFLLITAALGLWLEFGYGADATSAWDNIEELQRDIDRGLFVANVRGIVSVLAAGLTIGWLALGLAERRRLSLAIALVLGLSVAAWFVGGSASAQRSIIECAAAAIGLAAALYSLSKLSGPVVESGDELG